LGKVTELAGAAGVGKTNKFIQGSNYLYLSKHFKC